MMKSGTGLKKSEPGDVSLIDARLREPEAVTSNIVIRSMEGCEIEGLEACPDGICFRSNRGIAGGRKIEMVLCKTILVDAEVVGVILLPKSAGGGYLIRARFRNISAELQELIHIEMSRILGTGC